MVHAGPVRVEVLVEEPSAEVVLKVLLPKIAPEVDFEVFDLGGKASLLARFPGRVRGYASYAESAGSVVIVLVDRDHDDCLELKRRLTDVLDREWPGANGRHALVRIACEELEAWFFGDVPALRSAYPRLAPGLAEQARFRDPDAIRGGTGEALEDLLRRCGYVSERMPKLEVAAAVAPYMNVEENRSVSFRHFRDGVRRLVRGAA